MSILGALWESIPVFQNRLIDITLNSRYALVIPARNGEVQAQSLWGVFRHHVWASVQGGLFSGAPDAAFADSNNSVSTFKQQDRRLTDYTIGGSRSP